MATVSRAMTGERSAPWQTHEVFNQVPALEGRDVFSDNTPLVEATEREGASWVLERASALGRLIGGDPQQLWGRLANENKPVLRTFDRYGHRIDEVEFHPAWHELMKMGVEHELHSLPWTSSEPSPHTARAALYMTAIQAEAGFACPTHDDVRGGAGVARAAGAGGRVGTARDGHDLRPAADPGEREGLGDRGHGDDREAGRLGCAREHDGGAPAERRRGRGRVRDHGSQVVLLGADVGLLSGAGAGAVTERRARGPVVLSAAARPAGRRAQRLSYPAAEGQARQPLERVERDRAARGLGAHAG